MHMKKNPFFCKRSGVFLTGKPSARQKNARGGYVPQDATVLSAGTRLRGVPMIQLFSDITKKYYMFFLL